mmetsp:Transcript_83483/g.234778  ORF Transcript_83483/g.234778 Transcript_83483/m.234778 type:complete len:83 (+) Transcript_83483:1554-1802(+)
MTKAAPTPAPTPLPARLKPCDAVCSIQGATYSCSARIAWAASHQFQDRPAAGACEAAHALVVAQCSASCAACSQQAALGDCP